MTGIPYYLIVCLGNPGIEYVDTRHNVGFLFADYLQEYFDMPAFKKKKNALYTESIVNNCKLMVIKPQTYMNLSGTAVAQFVSFYKIPTDCVFVVQDDIDLPFLKVKVKFSGSSGGHNGIKNIDANIGSSYWRIRIGVDRPQQNITVNNYVLSSFSSDQLEQLSQKFNLLSKYLLDLLLSNDKSNIINKINQSSDN